MLWWSGDFRPEPAIKQRLRLLQILGDVDQQPDKDVRRGQLNSS